MQQPMIDAHLGDQPPTVEEVTQSMKDAWARENERIRCGHHEVTAGLTLTTYILLFLTSTLGSLPDM